MAVLAVAALTASAQKGEFHITPHISLGYAGLTNTDVTVGMGDEDLANNLLGGIGADFEYMVSNTFGVSAGLDYNYIRSGNNTAENNNKKFEFYASYSFLNLSILAQVHFGEGFAVKAGIQAMFLLAADLNVDTDPSIGVKGRSVKDECESVSFAIPVGISYTFKTPVTIDLRCNIPVSKINKIGDDSSKFVGLTATIGYRF